MDNYAFVKYRDKIDFTECISTGLSLGGGKVMEYMADATRARKVAAIAPMCLAAGCPILSGLSWKYCCTEYSGQSKYGRVYDT